MPSTVENTFPGGWEFIGEAFLRRGVPENGLQAIKASLSPSTLRQYSSKLKKWWQFCISKGYIPFLYSLDAVINFLSDQFQNSCSYSTLNSQYEALALIFEINSSDKTILKRFIKGIFNQRPSRP
ncbi:unnamed protein product [Acanthoscelides obtectus]|uniref:Uncharacterized protein n=1 Tax=Acanthoscelides obtectus TaxID=200917 RepID=A0A9P0Q9Z8_ACAOB|nr:unnamed protein product [Acanthoscelides obtectus]CAK1633593.1 hypothetical protein AOBTE_LOCUS8244 [Acanthoscelides obtectus]